MLTFISWAGISCCGKNTFVYPSSKVDLPDDAIAIELRSSKAKLLTREELRDDWDGAVALQRKFTLGSVGSPKIEPPIEIPMFDNETLIGAEIFERVDDGRVAMLPGNYDLREYSAAHGKQVKAQCKPQGIQYQYCFEHQLAPHHSCSHSA